jgi:pimeloyl-ACP methyl ester carboxylesterase
MKIVDRGSGTPVVIVPGVQGRWEWMLPAVDALSSRVRVITFSLADEPTCSAPFDAAHGFDCYVRQVADAMDAAGVESAVVCGVSYGGIIAAAFAARYPHRVIGLVLVSAIPPSWKPDERVRVLTSSPRLMTPLFCIGAFRLYSEIAIARGGTLAGVRFMMFGIGIVLRYPFRPTLMARRPHLLDRLDLEPDIRRIERPVLVITGDEPDRVVPAHLTREYLQLLPQARAATIPRTGHLGLITRPDVFADLIVDFIGPLCSPEREFCRDRSPHSGPRPREARQEILGPAKGSAGT